MSPDASVHEEQLEEIKTQRALRDRGQRIRRKSRNKSCCCATGCLIILLLLLAAGAWYVLFGAFDSDVSDPALPPSERGGMQWPERENLESWGGMLDYFRSQAGTVEDRWSELRESGVMEERLDALREDLKTRSDTASSTLKTQLETSLEQVEALREKIREKGQTAPEEVEAFKKLLKQLEILDAKLAPAESEEGADAPEDETTTGEE